MGFCEKSAVSRLLASTGGRLVWTWEAQNGTNIPMTGSISLRTDCFVEFVNLSVILLTLVATVLLALKYKCCNNRHKFTTGLLPLHTLRTSLCILLLLFLLLELSESLMLFAPLLPLLSILTVISCWIVHRGTEVGDGFGVVVTGAGFTVIAVARAWRLLYLNRFGLMLKHVRMTSSAGTAVCCGLLAIVDSYALYRMMQKSKLYTVRPIENIHTSYKHGTSPFISKLTFHWVVDLLARGYQTPLDLNDLGHLPKEESTRVQFEKFLKIYEEEKKQSSTGKLSLWRCFWKRVWFAFAIGGILKLFGDAITLVGPMAISKIMDYVTSTQNASIVYPEVKSKNFVTISQLMENGYFLGLLVFLAAILQSTLSQASTHILNIEGIHLRTALQTLVYDKALRLCSWSIAEDEKPPDKEKDGQRHQAADIGTLTNLMAEDAYNVMSFFWIGHYTWAIPLKISAIIFLLYLKLGISAIAGAICCILIVTPLQLYLGKLMSINSKAITDRSDARLRLVNEVLQGMRLVKLRAWEALFEDRVRRTRNQELQLLDKDSLYWALITFLTHASSVLMTLFTFGLYFSIEERHLDAGSVFASLALFSQLTVPLFIFPVIVPIIINAMISTTRLEEFLLLPEIVNVLPENNLKKFRKIETNRSKVTMDNINAEANDVQEVNDFGALDNIEESEEDHDLFQPLEDSIRGSVFVNTDFEKDSKSNKEHVVKVNGVFSWCSNENQLIIAELGLSRGKLTLIVGRTGSGKTSLLSAMLGEIQTVKGKVDWTKNTKIAYVAQKPWLLNATLRDNILFGSKYQPRRYRTVLRACALQPDVDILPGRDLTRIGEKGINLSGGQKHRIAIARAIYSNADTVILDDPLSALDQQVGQQIFELGVRRLLLRRGRTVIMVTHRLELLSAADRVVAMQNCRVRAVGSRSSIEKLDPDLAAEWKEVVRKQDDKPHAHKTARDRWSLIRLVSRIGITVRHRHASDGSWITDQDAHVTTPTFVPLRMRRSTLSGSRYLAHDLTDLPVPAEEFDAFKKHSRKHRDAVRAASLQPPKHPPPVLRQSSTPTILECRYVVPRKRLNTIDNGQQNNRLKQLFSSRTTSNQEWDHHPVKRLLSTESEVTDEVDDGEEKSTNFHDYQEAECHEDSSGLVTADVWLDYLRSGGLIPGLTYVGAALACQALRVYTDLWLSRWTDQGSHPDVSIDRHEDTAFYFRIYMALSVGSILLSALYNATGQWAGAKARRRLHQEAVSALLNAPLSFFERTPIGRILNRFSADMGVVDKKLSISIQRLTAFVLLCGSAMLVNIIISPWFMLAAILTCAAYYFLQRFYRRSARELQRLDGCTRGPAAAHFSETLAGLSTLRASKQEARFMQEMIEYLDANTNAFLALNTSSRWLGIALDYLGAVIVLAAIYTVLISAELYPSRVTPSLVGLAINYTLLVPIYLNWVVKFISEIEMYMGSVSRLRVYAKTPRENYRENGCRVSKDWPRNGEIVFENVSLRYDLQRKPIVVNLNLRIPSRQKLGICGRTGSGKSSTAMALFQLVEVCQGRILLDDVDTRQVPLRTLRSRLSTIPQDVIMFSGTIRENLDPLSEHTDDELWTALELAQIKDLVMSHAEGLNTEVREGGENFSAGQRQLLSMARAVLQQSAVVVLDEATSAIDAATEMSLLQAASMAFKDKTVITIAHRVASLLDCDRIIVFDEGRIIEDGPPVDLLQRPMGFFLAMLKASENNEQRS